MRKSTFVCKENMCNGCMACVEVCPVSAITVVDEMNAYNAVIDASRCIHCDKCVKICPNNGILTLQAPISWKQGWAKNETVRACASSGGLASALSEAFIRSGGTVCSCCLKNGVFGFSFADRLEELGGFRGSKYVKSNPKGIYKEIKARLKNGARVLFIGLPCQVAGVKRFVGDEDNLYTVDLICHGTPSPHLLSLFLNESGRFLSALQTIEFREKDKWFLRCDGKRLTPPTVMDRYMLTFLQSEDYTENCYSCQFAREERVADITLGDAWGSDLPREEREKGISLVLCQNEKGRALLDTASVQLFDIDKNIAVAFNKQLAHPSPKLPSRDVFFAHLKRHGNFKRAVAKIHPRSCLRMEIKSLLVRTGIFRTK